jgi:hypothetical protein
MTLDGASGGGGFGFDPESRSSGKYLLRMRSQKPGHEDVYLPGDFPKEQMRIWTLYPKGHEDADSKKTPVGNEIKMVLDYLPAEGFQYDPKRSFAISPEVFKGEREAIVGDIEYRDAEVVNFLFFSRQTEGYTTLKERAEEETGWLVDGVEETILVTNQVTYAGIPDKHLKLESAVRLKMTNPQTEKTHFIMVGGVTTPKFRLDNDFLKKEHFIKPGDFVYSNKYVEAVEIANNHFEEVESMSEGFEHIDNTLILEEDYIFAQKYLPADVKAVLNESSEFMAKEL